MQGGFLISEAGDKILSKNKNENSLQRSPEQRELPEALWGYGQSNQAYEARPFLAQDQGSHPGKEQEELAGTGERVANGSPASLEETKKWAPRAQTQNLFLFRPN